MTLVRRYASLVIVFLMTLGGTWRTHAQAPTPNIQVEGDHFTRDGNPDFMIFVSYFDALRASPSAWDSDLTWLSNYGIQGVRIFPNWWHYCPSPTSAADDAVIGAGGAVNNARLDVLKSFLLKAAQKNMVVDVSFTRETVSPEMTVDQYKNAIAYIAQQIAGYENVIVDVQNEWDKGDKNFTDSQIDAVMHALKNGVPGIAAGDPTRLVTASSGSTTPSSQVSTAIRDFLAFHGDRGDFWYTDSVIGNDLDAVRSNLLPAVKPIHLQEPKPFDQGCSTSTQTDLDTSHAALAIQAAKHRGAAGWTFHNRVGMNLSGTSLYDVLSGAERAAIQGLRAQANAQTSWGVAAFSVSPSSQTVGAGAGSSSLSLARLAGSTADWSASTSDSWIHLNAFHGSGLSVGFSYDQNGSAARTGTISVSGRLVTVTQDGVAPPATTHMSLDTPHAGSVAMQFLVGGWAIDTAAPTGPGVDVIHVYGFPNPGSGQNPVFLGQATYGVSRPDVASAFHDPRFTPSGFNLGVTLPSAGPWMIAAYARSTATGGFSQMQSAVVTAYGGPIISVDVPGDSQTVSRPFVIGGWSLDASASSGNGSPVVHVYAYPGGAAPAIFLGAPSTGVSRPDVGAWLQDGRFTPSGFNLSVGADTLPSPGWYLLAVFPYSSVTNSFGSPLTRWIYVQ